MDTQNSTGNFWKFLFLVYGTCSVVALNFLDPINWPKQIALLTILPFLFFEAIRLSNIKKTSSFRVILLTFSLSAFLLTLAGTLDAPNSTRLLWGAWGRNNGLVTLLSLLVVAFSFSLLSNQKEFLNAVVKSLSLVFIPASAYGLIQSFFTDPINWSAKGQVFSFFGNPNFASSILSVSAIASMYSFMLSRGSRISNLYLTQGLASVVVVWNTQSIQGLVAIGISLVFFLYFLLVSREKLNKLIGLIFISLVAFVVGIGFIGKGPMGQILFQYTAQLRSFYWATGIRMGMENPLFGVGIDSFGDFYRTNRTLQIAQITSVDLTVDNAHNSVIQIFATLGIVGLIAYFLVFIPALLKLFGYLWKVQLSKTEWAIASLFISTFSISLISIDNIGVAIINWSLAGICVGVFFTKRGLSSPNEIRHSSPKRIIINSSSLEVLRPSIVGLLSLSFFVFGWLASSPDRELINIFRTPADTNIQGSIDKRWGALFGLGKSNGSLQEAQYRFVIQGIDETNTWPIALQAAEIGIKKYPRDFTLLDRAAVVAEKMGKFTEAKDLRQRQLEIDPRHPLVRLYLARSLVELGETSRATIEVKKAREFESLLSTEGLNYLKSLEQKIQEVQNG